MIAKITQGASGRDLVRYLFGPGRANEHTDQRVITSGIVMGVEEGRGLTAAEIADLGSALDVANDSYGANPADGHIWHLSLSVPSGDRHLTDDEWAAIAQRAIDAVGFEEAGLAPAAWVAIGHGTSANGNEHIHIVASLVRVDGSRVDVWQSKRTLSRVCAEAETTYGLTPVIGREKQGMPGLTRAELERAAREHRGEPPRVVLARLAREALSASKDETEFVRRLRGSGAIARPRFETGGKEAVVGYSVALRPENGADPIWFGGGKLGRDLTLPYIRSTWEQTADDRKDAVLEWSATRAYFLGRESVLGDPGDWQRAVAGVERSVDRLLAVPASDLATWRGAAREAAGVFAAWSRRIEGDSPGPMAAAADLLARSAQGRPGEPLPNRAAVRDFRGVAAIVAQSGLNNDSPMAWAMLISQLGQTLRAIGDAHAARGEAQMAEALGARSADELLQLQERFETTSARELAPRELTWEGRIASAIGEVAENQSGQRREHGLNRLRGIEH